MYLYFFEQHESFIKVFAYHDSFSASTRDLNSPSDDEEDENDNEVSFASKENASPSAPSSPVSPQPQLVTGDLGRMCAIM